MTIKFITQNLTYLLLKVNYLCKVIKKDEFKIKI